MSLSHGLEQAVEQLPVERVGEASARTIHHGIVQHGWARGVADILHGTWLGHPLHPALTDVVVGAWVAGGVFDALGEWQDSDQARWAGDRLAALGMAAAVPTALSGLADYSAAPRAATRAATVHGLLNTLNFALYGVSLWERARGNRRRGLALSWAAQGLLLASAWLGGELVYKHRVGVDHGESFDGTEGWQAVLSEDALKEGEPRRVELDGKGVLLYRHEGEILAIGAVCSHAGGPLEHGSFEGTCVKCPWHDSVFDLRDGHVVHGPATYSQASFQVRVRDGRIELRATGT